MKDKLFKSLLVLAGALLALGLAACVSATTGPASSSASPQVVEAPSGDATDQMHESRLSGAELRVFAIDGAVRAIPRCEALDSWAGPNLRDGGFYRVVADVTLLNGGIAGYVDYPVIDHVESCEEVSPYGMGLPSIEETAYGLVLIGDYADGDVLARENGIKAVWKDGSWVYRYDSEIDLGSGAKACVRRGVTQADVQAGVESGVLSCADYFVLPSAS